MNKKNLELGQTIGKIGDDLVSLPEGTEMAGGPLDQALIKGHDGYTPDPAMYMAIFDKAAARVTNPERQATYLLEALNGARRRPGLWNTLETEGMLLAAKKAIQAIGGGGSRKTRLEGLSYYHGGLLYRMVGEYLKAGAEQICAGAALAQAGRFQEANTSIIAAKVELLNWAIQRGVDRGELSALHEACSLQNTWGLNPSKHYVLGHFLLRSPIGDPYFQQMGPVLGAPADHDSSLFAGIRAWRAGEADVAHEFFLKALREHRDASGSNAMDLFYTSIFGLMLVAQDR
ncbi:MAG TPA: hypothetical protein VJB37_00385, partial [Patescibacteria group bacterium]|nr:hypothetical protein [Patescibacteria group bacterium]